MGVGFSVSRSIIEAPGGQMWATANDGHGATFAFSIPANTSANLAKNADEWRCFDIKKADTKVQ